MKFYLVQKLLLIEIREIIVSLRYFSFKNLEHALRLKVDW